MNKYLYIYICIHIILRARTCAHIYTYKYVDINVYIYTYIYLNIYTYLYTLRESCLRGLKIFLMMYHGKNRVQGRGYGVLSHSCYGVATISRLLEIIELFCKRALQKNLYSAKET